MRYMRPGFVAFCVLAFLCGEIPSEAAETVRFNQSIRPVLSDNCFACHGPDANQRKGKLRFDLHDSTVEKGVIVAGKPEESNEGHLEMIQSSWVYEWRDNQK